MELEGNLGSQQKPSIIFAV